MSHSEEEAITALAHLNDATTVNRSRQRSEMKEAIAKDSKSLSRVRKSVVDRDDLDDDDELEDHDLSKQVKRGKRAKDEFKFPVEPRILAVVKKPRTYMNHSYRDFSSVPPELTHEEPTEITSMSFSQKVHHILSQEEHSKWISWMPHGRAFRIHIPKLFEQKVSPKYFGHSRYSSFLRQLNNYGFKHITQGNDRNCYYHEFMLRGLPHLCKYMPKPKDARRLIPDPENEPDFYRISKMYPLPDDPSFGKKAKDPEGASPPALAAPANVAVASPIASLKRPPADLNWITSQVPDAKRMRGMTPDPLMSLTASSGLNAPVPTLSGVNWPLQAAPVSTFQAALDQNAVLAALAGYGTLPRSANLADYYPSVSGANAQNLFNAFRHL